jgi:hydrogenase maturation protease
VVVIGFGTPERGDDAAGLEVVRRLRRRIPANVDLREETGDPVRLMDCWEGFDRVILVDAVVSGAPPGTLHRLDGRRLPAPGGPRLSSSHALGVETVLSVAGYLGRLPSSVVVIGIEGAEFHAGGGISREVQSAIPEAAARILREIRDAE